MCSHATIPPALPRHLIVVLLEIILGELTTSTAFAGRFEVVCGSAHEITRSLL
jgi:hypothetical protein